jgi:predicted dehydrogenase
MREKTITPKALGIPSTIPMPHRTDWRIGLVGFGNVAHEHAPAYTAAGWKITAVADPDPAAREAARRLTGGAGIYDDFPDLVKDDEVEIVSVLTQPTLREPVVAAAAEAGKPILIEKPFATSLEECERMVEIADRAGVPFAVSQNYRWHPAPFYARQIMARGFVGRPYLASIEIHGEQDVTVAPHPFYPKSEDFLTIQWNNHLADLMRYWLDRAPRRVFCCTRRMAGQNFLSDNLLVSVSDFGEGVTGHILHSELLRSSLFATKCRIDGDKGSMVFDLYGDHLELQCHRFGDEVLTLDTSHEKRWTSFAGPMGDLLRSIEEHREPQTSARDNLQTIRHVLAEAKSARAGGIWTEV